jgi:hypothetical protein
VEELEYNLDATILEDADIYYENIFKNLLLNIYSCYEYMLADKIKVPKNNENEIRDILYKYISKRKIRNEICNIYGFNFDKEVDEKTGRIDLKIKDINDFEDFDSYYIIECKRLDGKSTLNKYYINHGINRFTSGYYSSSYGINGMLAFVVEKIDIHSNMDKIGGFFNCLEINKLYDSNHSNKKLFHLIMDFSSNIK